MMLSFSSSINRNILECKDGIRNTAGETNEQVLIETYWNVKQAH